MAAREPVPAAAIVLAGLLLAWPAAWNGYPLVFADSGTYLGQALIGYLGWDRPPHYSLFLHLLHWRVSLWAIPVAQGLITAHLLALVLRALERPGPWPLLIGALGLAVATGLPWLVAQIMPDLFTGLLVLALWLIGFGWRDLSRVERAYVMLLACGAAALHLTHLPIGLGLALVGGIAAGRAGVAGRMAAPVLIGMIAVVAANAAGHGRVSLSPFGAVFMGARLLEDGPALRTLDADCAVQQWRVCAMRAELPMAANYFLWLPDGPLQRLGGGKAWAAEAGEIVSRSVSREPGTVALTVLDNAARQFVMLGTGDGLEAWRGEPGPEPIIARFFPRELDAYAASRQSRGLLQGDVAQFLPLHVALAWASLFLLPMLAWVWRARAAGALCVLVLAAALGNAAVTGGLSGVNERYQGRLAWLFVFAAGAALAAYPQGRLLVRHAVQRRDAT
ncbi:hypothetical protein [Falsiroseomonas sp. HW251]|uniref:hypothetical protein n=1 Tax=Falsiroseomonas sp. HW251 TaxID=3390998 RepID=UPI003D31C5C4